MVILDTSVLVEAHRLQGSAEVKLAFLGLMEVFQAAICGPVEMEFLGGARSSEIKALETFCDILPYVRSDQKIWRKAANNFSELKAKGLTIPWNDVLIATIAMENGCRVYAVDRHFEAMGNLFPDLDLYRPGYGGMYRESD